MVTSSNGLPLESYNSRGGINNPKNNKRIAVMETSSGGGGGGDASQCDCGRVEEGASCDPQSLTHLPFQLAAGERERRRGCKGLHVSSLNLPSLHPTA